MADTNAPLPLLPAHCDRRRAEAAWHSGGEPSDRPDGLFDTTAFTGPPIHWRADRHRGLVDMLGDLKATQRSECQRHVVKT